MNKIFITLTASFAALLVTVSARPEYVKLIPNGSKVSGITALGHADGTGDSDALDPFGEAFAKAGNKWTTALCQADSDGDGQTNGEELGDPCCVWTTGATPKFTSGVSNPGDAAMKVTASILSANSCSAKPTSAPTLAPTSAPTTAKTTAPTAAPASAATSTTTAAPPTGSAEGKTGSPAAETSTATPAPSAATASSDSSDASEYMTANTTTAPFKSSSPASSTTPSPTAVSTATPVYTSLVAGVVAGFAALAL